MTDQASNEEPVEVPLRELEGMHVLDGWCVYEGPRVCSGYYMGMTASASTGLYQGLFPPMGGETARGLPFGPSPPMEVGDVADIAVTVQAPYRVRRIAIGDGAIGWWVHQILVGNRDQLTGPIAAHELMGHDLMFATAQTGQQIVMRIQNVGGYAPRHGLARLDGKIYRFGYGRAHRVSDVVHRTRIVDVPPRLVSIVYTPDAEVIAGRCEAAGALVLAVGKDLMHLDPHAQPENAPPLELQEP